MNTETQKAKSFLYKLKSMREENLTPLQLEGLFIIFLNTGCSSMLVNDHLSISPMTLSRLVRGLEAEGLILVVRDKTTNKRTAPNLFITHTGERFIKKYID